MPLPKRRHSKTRTATRRATWVKTPPTLDRCKNCQELKRRHAVCKNCGYYNGRLIVEKADQERAA